MRTSPLSILFTGHMVDLPDRTTPRFPPGLVTAAREQIARRVAHYIRTRSVETVKGFGSLARGGDILFHEVCRSFSIDTVIVLPFSPEEFLVTSVEGLDTGDWSGRFRRLWEETAPDARFNLGLQKSDTAYSACNDELLKLAQGYGDVQMIALWDGSGGDDIGGTAHFIKRVKEISSQEPDIIDPNKLF
jgi:hypothetical protein